MDDRLVVRLKKIDDQITVLRELEEEFLHLEAHENILYAKIYSKQNFGSIEDRKQAVYVTEDWQAFIKGYVACKAAYLEAKRRYELKLKAYDAEHLTFKNEAPAIRRQL